MLASLNGNARRTAQRLLSWTGAAALERECSMPACFQLYDKQTNEAEKLSIVDEKLCSFLGIQPDPVKYVNGWYDSIGFRLAVGKTFEQIRTEFTEYVNEPNNPYAKGYSNLLTILQWIEENYSPNSWREVGRS